MPAAAGRRGFCFVPKVERVCGIAGLRKPRLVSPSFFLLLLPLFFCFSSSPRYPSPPALLGSNGRTPLRLLPRAGRLSALSPCCAGHAERETLRKRRRKRRGNKLLPWLHTRGWTGIFNKSGAISLMGDHHVNSRQCGPQTEIVSGQAQRKKWRQTVS
ncbi:hypothetical protein LZ31DRAFT_246565 [Colletotrichum somersetense]|nr:hypothetical protein LZ31DRAFT_246565 [Colletotrichum somersetense]